MGIIAFEQDVTKPFGTGNFKDETGKSFYLADPETAQRFVSTMPGQTAKPQLPDAGLVSPDTLSNLTPDPAAMAGIAQGLAGGTAPANPVQGGAAPAPGAPGSTVTPGERASLTPDPAALASIAQGLNAPAAAPGAPAMAPGAPGGPGAPAAPPGAPGLTPDPAALAAIEAGLAKQGAPADGHAAPAAPGGTPQNAGHALIANLDQSKAMLANRSKLRPGENLAQPGAQGLPLQSISGGQGVNVTEGRPLENALEQVNDEEAAGRSGDATLQNVFDARGNRIDTAARTLQKATEAGAGRDVAAGFAAKKERADAEANLKRVRDELAANDKSLDPERVIRNMSTGKRIGMMILAALNGGFGALIGQKSNGVVDELNNQIERDIDKQKGEIASGKVRLGNLIDQYMKKGADAETAEKLARDNIIGSIAKIKDIEAKRIEASGENAAQAQLLLAPRLEERAKRRGEILKDAESKVQRTFDNKQVNAVPQIVPGATAQDILAMMQIGMERVKAANTGDLEAALGHPVTPEEAFKIKQDAQEYASKSMTNRDTLNRIASAATGVGMVRAADGEHWEVDPNRPIDPGTRPLGSSALSQHARNVDRLWTSLQEAKVMASSREPSAKLQDAFGQIIERPFNDADIPAQLNMLVDIASNADKGLRAGYGDAARYFDYTANPQHQGAPAPQGSAPYIPTTTPKSKQDAAAAATSPVPAAAPAPPPAAAPPPARPGNPKAGGNLRVENL